MIKLKPGETMNQHFGVDPAPFINKFVKKSEFIEPKPQKTFTNAVKFGKK